MKDPDSVATLFDLAISLETIAQAVYRRLAERFSHVPEASDFWDGMKNDEIQHARELENIRNSLSLDTLISKADTDMLRKARELMKFSVGDALKSVKTLEDAYQLAHKLEHSEVNAIFSFLSARFITSGTRLHFVQSEIERHLDKLMKFPATFGDPTRRASVLAKAA